MTAIPQSVTELVDVLTAMPGTVGERGEWVCNEKRLIETAGLSSLNALFAEIPIERERLLEWVDLVADRLGAHR